MLCSIKVFAFVALVTLTKVMATNDCNVDDCLGALSQSPESNSAFCSSYTMTTAFGPTPSEIASSCSSSSSSISSACSCFVTSTTSSPDPPSSTTTSSTTTPSTTTSSATTLSTTTPSTTTSSATTLSTITSSTTTSSATTLSTITSRTTTSSRTKSSSTVFSNTTTSSTTASTTATSTPCATNVCFSVQFNSQSVPSGDTIWLSAVFKPKFSGTLSTVSFTNSYVIINNVQVSTIPPDSFIQLDSSLQTCSTAQFIGGTWQTTAPLPGAGNTFLSAVSIPVPAGTNYANAQVSWCGDITAPGEVDVQIAAAIYTSCSEAIASPEACETHTNYHAGVPTGCLNNLVAGGTGGGGSNYSGSLSATYAECKAN